VGKLPLKKVDENTFMDSVIGFSKNQKKILNNEDVSLEEEIETENVLFSVPC
jgi:hypothetical protein